MVQLKKADTDKSVPPFPEKKLFKNNAKVIEERKEKLQEYLNQLVKNINLFDDIDLCDFF